jgi:hypothetical protein
MTRFAGFADNGGMPFEKYTPAVSRTAKPKNPTKPKVRNARNVAIDDEDGFIPEAKKGNTMVDYYDISRGPYHAILDKMALARQAQFGESYAQAFTKVYEAHENTLIRDGARFDHLAKAMDATHGTKLSLIPAAKAAAPMDPAQDFVDPAHAELNELVVTRMKADPKLSYAQSFTREYLSPANRGLKARVDAESILRAQTREPAPSFPA